MADYIEASNKKQIAIESILIIVILILALILRTYKLNHNSLWTDEGTTWWITYNEPLIQSIKKALGTDQQPFYYILINFWIRLFGTSEISLRFPSIIFGLASVFLTYKLSTLLFNNKELGIIASCITTFSTLNIDLSQEARPYTLTIFLALLSNYHFIKLARKENLKNLFFYLIFSTLLIYTHTQGVFTLFAQNIFFITFCFFQRKKENISLITWIFLQLIILILFLPWFFNLMIRPDEIDFFWCHPTSLDKILRTLTDYFSGSYILIGPFLITIFVGVWASKGLRSSVYFLFLLFLTPLLIFYLFSPFYVERYTVCASVPFYILIATGLYEIRKLIKVPIIILIIILSSSLWLISTNNYYKTYYPYVYKNIAWKSIIKFIEKNATKDDLLIFDSPFIKHLHYDYYSKRKDLTIIGFSYKYLIKTNYKIISNELEPYLKTKKRIWLVEFHIEDKNKWIEKRMKENFKLARIWEYNERWEGENVSIKLYEND